MDEIATNLIKMLSKYTGISSEHIEPSTLIIEELHLDSLDIVELLANIEDIYGIYIPDSELIEMRTVGDVTNYLSKVLAQ